MNFGFDSSPWFRPTERIAREGKACVRSNWNSEADRPGVRGTAMIYQSSASSASETSGREYAFGNLRLQADGTLMRGDEEIHLPPKELAALKLLLAHAGQIVTHQQLKHALWGNVHVTDDS